MSIYGIKARHLTRQAWLNMGKARELQFQIRTSGSSTFTQDFDRMLLRQCVSTARLFMQTAVLYRQMDGRL